MGEPDKTTDWSHQWPRLYADTIMPMRYGGDDITYRRAGAYLSGPGLVEEWGCGTTYAKQFVGAPYRGVDGAPNAAKFGAVTADLRTYRSEVPKILMRHVLEHNWEWREILTNMLSSFTDRACLILFIPPGKGDVNMSFSPASGDVPESPPGLQLDESDLEHALINGLGDESHWQSEDVTGHICPPFNHEVIYFLSK